MAGYSYQVPHTYLQFRIYCEVYLLSSIFVGVHVSVQLCAIHESVAAEGATEVILAFLMTHSDVLLQRCVPLVTTGTVRTGVEL